MQIHNLVQGSEEWHQFRLEHYGASEAAPMLGLSSKVKRNELLYMKKTGTAKEFSDFVQVKILDPGHELEALARPIQESNIGEDLYPVTCSEGMLSASCDGLTMDESIGWEHKQWNDELAAAVLAGKLPDEYMPQVQQCLMITGAEVWIFTVSDGTRQSMISMEISPDPVWFDRIRKGWDQFAKDLEDYQHVEVLPTPVPEPVIGLPALSIQVSGAISLQSNLVPFGDRLKSFVDAIDMKPSDDQAFANAEAAVKTLQKAQDALEAAESGALAQTASIDEMRRMVAMYRDLARNTRLALEKVVEARKKTIRIEIQQEAKAKSDAHISALNERLGKPYMPVVPVDFASVMKGKKTISSLRDAVDTELACFKIEANAIADRIQTNLATLRELAINYPFLFADTSQIVLKATDDCTALIRLRISEHKASEEKRLEAERARIAEEERIKAEAKLRAEQEVAAAAARQAAIEETQKQREADQPMAVRTEPESVPSIKYQFPNPPRTVEKSAPTLTIGKIGTRLGFALSADFLRSIGIESAGRERSAVLYHEEDWEKICAALITHIAVVRTSQKEAA